MRQPCRGRGAATHRSPRIGNAYSWREIETARHWRRAAVETVSSNVPLTDVSKKKEICGARYDDTLDLMVDLMCACMDACMDG